MLTHRPTLARVIAAALFAAATFGCSTKHTVAPVASSPAPPPNTPANVVKRIEWDWQHRDTHYMSLLTDDFRFVFAEGDSGSGQWNYTPWDRVVESSAIYAMFDAGSLPPRLVSFSFDLDPTFDTMPDPRPGKDPKWHKAIRSHVNVVADLDLGSGLERRVITGGSLFFLVRGDSAMIPPDLVLEGVRPDSTVWWLERWEDETLVGPLRPAPIQAFTLGHLKWLFVPPPRGPAR